MAASSAGAVKAKIEGGGLSLSAFRDEAPEGQSYPYATIREAISVVGEFNPLSDNPPHVSELVQVDLWQQWRHPTTRAVTESYTLAPALFALLHGTRLPAAPKFTYQVSVESMVRMLERNDNLVHHALTLRIRRAS